MDTFCVFPSSNISVDGVAIMAFISLIVDFCAAVLFTPYICMFVPFFFFALSTSRHTLSGLLFITKSFPAWQMRHFCPSLLLSLKRCTLVLFLLEPPFTSRHFLGKVFDILYQPYLSPSILNFWEKPYRYFCISVY